MCDYSLMSLPNRLAVCGDELIVHRFELGAIGLASAADVCSRQKPSEDPKLPFSARLKKSSSGSTLYRSLHPSRSTFTRARSSREIATEPSVGERHARSHLHTDRYGWFSRRHPIL